MHTKVRMLQFWRKGIVACTEWTVCSRVEERGGMLSKHCCKVHYYYKRWKMQ